MIRTLAIILCLSSLACRTTRVPAAAKVAAKAPKPLAGAFVDLEPGWRLRVITPLIAGGGYVVKTAPAAEQGNTITMRAGQDFLGYETAYYEVREGLKVRFATAELTRDGHTASQTKALHPLFSMRRGMKHMRLVFLERGSDTSHDMAVITARDRLELDARTVRLQASPSTGCQGGCEWVPAGIAVRPEMQKAGEWVPAR